MTPSPGELVKIVYIEDSKQDELKGRKFQVMGAVIIPDDDFYMVEQDWAYYVYEKLPAQIRDTCEVHATDLWNGNKPFDGIPQAERIAIFNECVGVIERHKLAIVFGAVDLCKLYATLYASAKPIDISFRVCAQAVEQWFVERAPESFGLLICDNTSNKHIKDEMLNAFRLYRKFVRSSPPSRGIMAHIHDDMYFGDSTFSVGIQLADVCTLLISRHLAGYEDSEPLYKRIEHLIFRGTVEPHENNNE
jgi:hypothetical protein